MIDAGAGNTGAPANCGPLPSRSSCAGTTPCCSGPWESAVQPGILERGFILAMRTAFQQAVNLRPVKLYPGVATPIAGLIPSAATS